MIHQQHIRAYVRRLAMVRRKGLSFRFYAYGDAFGLLGCRSADDYALRKRGVYQAAETKPDSA